MSSVTIISDNQSDLDMLIALAKRLNARIVQEEKSPYNPEFVEKIRQAEQSESIVLTPELRKELFGA